MTTEDEHIPFQKMRNQTVRIHPKYGVQEVNAKPCQKGGDVFLVMRSGDRMIGFSLIEEEVRDVQQLLDEALENGAAKE